MNLTDQAKEEAHFSLKDQVKSRLPLNAQLSSAPTPEDSKKPSPSNADLIAMAKGDKPSASVE